MDTMQFVLNIAVQNTSTGRLMIFSAPDQGVALEISVQRGDFDEDAQSKVLAMLVMDLPELVGEAIQRAQQEANQ
jgi:hypothetical protein